MTATYLNYQKIENTPVTQNPFPHIIIDHIFNPFDVATLMQDYPKINHLGSIPLHTAKSGPQFQKLIDELMGDELRALIAKKLNMDLSNRPPLITLRGQSGKRDGHIHTDSKTKLVTVLLYMNPEWESETGHLRLLNDNHNLENYFAEISPKIGSCIIFKVTDNGWHGYKPFYGERRSIQLNYLVDESVLQKQVKKHGFSAFIKKIFKKSEY